MPYGGARWLAERQWRAGAEGEPFDEGRLLETVGCDRELLAEIVELFLEDAPAAVERLGAALESGQSQRVWRAAHALKGSVVNFSADRAARLAQEIEGAAERNDLETAREQAKALVEEIGRLSVALEQYRR